MPRRTLVVGAGAVVAAAVCGVGLGVAAMNASTATPDSGLGASEVIEGLKPRQTQADVLPSSIDLEELDDAIDRNSTRLLGEDRTSSYWMGTKEDGDVCLITDFVQQVSAVACTSPDRLQQDGMAWSLAGDPASEGYRAVVALALPDSSSPGDMRVNLGTTGTELSGRAATEATQVLTEVSPNLLVADASDLDPRLQFVIPSKKSGDQSSTGAADITFTFDPTTVPSTTSTLMSVD